MLRAARNRIGPDPPVLLLLPLREFYSFSAETRLFLDIDFSSRMFRRRCFLVFCNGNISVVVFTCYYYASKHHFPEKRCRCFDLKCLLRLRHSLEIFSISTLVDRKLICWIFSRFSRELDMSIQRLQFFITLVCFLDCVWSALPRKYSQFGSLRAVTVPEIVFEMGAWSLPSASCDSFWIMWT